MRGPKAFSLLPVLALVVLTSCSKKTQTTATTTTTTTTTASSITTTAASPCPFTTDFVSPSTAPLINVQSPGGAATAVTAQTTVTCASVVTVDQKGAANVAFGGTAACQLTQDQPDAKVAKMTTRDPASVVFRLGEGKVHCTFGSGQPPIDLCGLGSLLATGDLSSAVATCDPEPVFDVQVFEGTFHLIDPAGNEIDMGPGQEYSFNFQPGQESSTTKAEFSTADRVAFRELLQFVKTG
jgi:hypothetical protein